MELIPASDISLLKQCTCARTSTPTELRQGFGCNFALNNAHARLQDPGKAEIVQRGAMELVVGAMGKHMEDLELLRVCCELCAFIARLEGVVGALIEEGALDTLMKVC